MNRSELKDPCSQALSQTGDLQLSDKGRGPRWKPHLVVFDHGYRDFLPVRRILTYRRRKVFYTNILRRSNSVRWKSFGNPTIHQHFADLTSRCASPICIVELAAGLQKAETQSWSAVPAIHILQSSLDWSVLPAAVVSRSGRIKMQDVSRVPSHREECGGAAIGSRFQTSLAPFALRIGIITTE